MASFIHDDYLIKDEHVNKHIEIEWFPLTHETKCIYLSVIIKKQKQ